MILKEEDYKALKPYESILKRFDDPKKSVYLSAQKKTLLMPIYKQITGDKSCSTCSSNWLRRLSVWYFLSKSHYLPGVNEDVKNKLKRIRRTKEQIQNDNSHEARKKRRKDR